MKFYIDDNEPCWYIRLSSAIKMCETSDTIYVDNKNLKELARIVAKRLNKQVNIQLYKEQHKQMRELLK